MTALFISFSSFLQFFLGLVSDFFFNLESTMFVKGVVGNCKLVVKWEHFGGIVKVVSGTWV